MIFTQRMCSETSGSSEEDKPIFQPLTRDSLAQIQVMIIILMVRMVMIMMVMIMMVMVMVIVNKTKSIPVNFHTRHS